MKRLPLRVTSFVAALFVATMLATGAAMACSDIVIGAGWSCELTGSNSSYCFYDCECHGISEAQCGNRLGLAGFELI